MTQPTTAQPDSPEWASGVSADIVEPSSDRKALGWEVDDKPPAGWMNWWKNLVYQWVAYLEEWRAYFISTEETVIVMAPWTGFSETDNAAVDTWHNELGGIPLSAYAESLVTGKLRLYPFDTSRIEAIKSVGARVIPAVARETHGDRVNVGLYYIDKDDGLLVLVDDVDHDDGTNTLQTLSATISPEHEPIEGRSYIVGIYGGAGDTAGDWIYSVNVVADVYVSGMQHNIDQIDV